MQHLFSHTHVQAKKVKGATKPIKAIDPKTCKKASAKNPTPRYNAGLIYEAFSAAGCDKTELDDVSFFYSCKFFLYIVNTHTKKNSVASCSTIAWPRSGCAMPRQGKCRMHRFKSRC